MTFRCGAYYPLGLGEEMSEGEYQASYCDPFDQVLDHDLDRTPRALREPQPPGLWKTRDGRVLVIAEMTVDHLTNSVNLFASHGWEDHPKIQELRKELVGRRS